MRWKIYFWIIASILLLSLYADAMVVFHKPGASAFDFIESSLDITALASYIFRKQILPKVFNPLFWRYFFVLRVIVLVLFLLYGFFPHGQFIQYLNLFYIRPPRMDGSLIIAILLDLPTFYAIYRLSQGRYYETEIKSKKITTVSQNKKPFQWGMAQMALWGYSSVITFFFFVLSLLPQNGSDKTSDQTYETIIFVISIIFLPIFIFWLWVVIRYKRYKWNWWRTTLVANALVLSGTTVFSIFDPQQSQTGSGFDFVGTLQILILLISLYVFGKDQFNPQKAIF